MKGFLLLWWAHDRHLQWCFHMMVGKWFPDDSCNDPRQWAHDRHLQCCPLQCLVSQLVTVPRCILFLWWAHDRHLQWCSHMMVGHLFPDNGCNAVKWWAHDRHLQCCPFTAWLVICSQVQIAAYSCDGHMTGICNAALVFFMIEQLCDTHLLFCQSKNMFAYVFVCLCCFVCLMSMHTSVTVWCCTVILFFFNNPKLMFAYRSRHSKDIDLALTPYTCLGCGNGLVAAWSKYVVVNGGVYYCKIELFCLDDVNAHMCGILILHNHIVVFCFKSQTIFGLYIHA